MSMQHFGKVTLRAAKNFTKGYTDVQAKVREATSNDPWGPTGIQMHEISQMTFNKFDFVEIMKMLDKRLNDNGKNWRHVFKALDVVNYLLYVGSENCVVYFKNNIYTIKTLKEFQYIDSDQKDQGANIRQKARDITSLLMDDTRLFEERRKRVPKHTVTGQPGSEDTILRIVPVPSIGYGPDYPSSPIRPSLSAVAGGTPSLLLYPEYVRNHLENKDTWKPLESQDESDRVDPAPRNAIQGARTPIEGQEDDIEEEKQRLRGCTDLKVMMDILDAQSEREFVQIVSSAKIYQRLIAYAYVQLKTSPASQSSRIALDSLQRATASWKAWDDVQWLAEHHNVRSTLWAILNGMTTYAPHPQIFDLRNLLNSDLVTIQSCMLTVLSNRDKKNAFFGICSADPVPVLNLLQTILDRGNLSNTDQPRFARTLARLVKSSACLPDCLMLSGVKRTGKDPVAGGGFADVWTGYFASTPVAIKALRIYDHSNQEKALRDFAHEAIIWRLLRHPNILKFYGVFRGDDRLCLVSPWMSAGNVIKYLEKNPESDRFSLLGDVINGLSYLHDFQPAIIHGDLKGANIFVTPTLTACLGDFGLSRFRDSQESTLGATTGNTTGTLRWQAPELFDSLDDGGTTRPSQESDIYSFGCVCLELMSGKPPFMEIRRDGAVMKAIMNGQTPRRPVGDPVNYGLDDNLWEVMEKCWSHDPTQRPEIESLLAYFDTSRASNNRPDFTEEIEHEFRASLDQYGFPEDHIRHFS